MFGYHFLTTQGLPTDPSIELKPLPASTPRVPIREILNRHLSRFLRVNHSFWTTAEEEEARNLLTQIGTQSAGEIIQKIKSDYYYNPTTKLKQESKLLACINEAFYEYFNIPKENICKAIMDRYRAHAREYQDEIIPPALEWHSIYNFIVTPMIRSCFNNTRKSLEIPVYETNTRSLRQLLCAHIYAYTVGKSPEDTGCKRAKELQTIIDANKNDDSKLFSDILDIYNKCDKDLVLKGSKYLHSSVSRALATFLDITEDDICVQEFDDCEKDLRKGDKDLPYRDIRNKAVHKLINTKVKNLRNTASAEESKSEISAETAAELCILTNNLFDAIGKHIKALEDLKQSPDDKDTLELWRAKKLLEKVMENAPKDELTQLKWSIETFCDFFNTSLLGDDFELRLVLGKVLCEEFNIKIESSFLQSHSCPGGSVTSQISAMIPLIQHAWRERIVTSGNTLKPRIP